MVDLMYLKHIWQSKIISPLTMTISNMVVELQQSCKALRNGQIDIFFINYLKDMMNEISWISLLVILLLMVISGLVML